MTHSTIPSASSALEISLHGAGPSDAAAAAPGAAFEAEAFVHEILDQARALSARWFRAPLEVERKADESPVTRADREVERFLRDRIAARFPQDGILGEEFGAELREDVRTWVIDPIDGTKSFITGWPIYGCLVSVVENGRPIFGAIDMPALRERWIGIAGQRSRKLGAPCAVSGVTELAGATLYATEPEMFRGADRAAFETLCGAVRMRRFGGDCYSFALLASGHIDLVAEADLKPYDYCALAPVVEGAGGVITDWDGAPLGLNSDGRVLAAASPALHAAALAVLQGGK